MSGNMDKEGGLVSRPPLLVGASNYDYWKSRMMTFLKSMDSKTWKAVLKGWDPPVIVDKEGKSTLELKPEEDWSKEEDVLALANSKALYALYNGVDKHIFKLIKKCVSANEAWKILETVHEAIEEAKDISEMKLDELVGSLQTYESAANERTEKKHKSIAFPSKTDEEDLEEDEDSNESISEAIVSLGRQFNKVLKRMDERPRPNAKNNALGIMRNIVSQGKPKSDEKPSLNKSIQCHECEGYGHVRPECPTYLKRANKGLTITWSDDDDESEENTASVTAKHISVLTGIVTSDTESCDGEVTYEELADSYRELYLKSEEICRVIEKQKVTIK
ncbi:gag-protease polyprotein [Trifolium pratense]|uniref:Gag-protease polyprotein n=1 Tax=Trifolium pratense TaxID=57577 RepID=A0A2K3MCW5_TRIPR|nr:gag-protease polyprotein [Trifolium pratense]